MIQPVEFPLINDYQSKFVTSFLNKNAKPFHQLIAPIGSGISKITLEIILRSIQVFGSQYFLILTSASLVDFFANSLRTKATSIPVINFDDRAYRRLVASVPVGENPWSKPVIAVMSIDFAKRWQVAENISQTNWDLIVVDEAHHLAGQRKDLLRRLVVENKVKRLLLFPISPLDPRSLSINDIETTVWKQGEYVFQSNIQIIKYSFGNAELVLINRLKEILHKQQNTTLSNFITEIMLKLTSSSLYALEQSLTRKLNASKTLGEMDEIDSEKNLNGDIERSEEIEPPEEAFLNKKDISELLDLIDLVADDPKYNSLYNLIQKLQREKESVSICIVSSYASTVSYISSRLAESGLMVYQITGSIGYESVVQTINKFQTKGGVLVISGVQFLKGLEIEKVDEIILYDLYGSIIQIQQKMYILLSRFQKSSMPIINILKEISDILPYEQRQIEAIRASEAIHFTGLLE
ncbi:MAG: hypothetical protein NTX38_17210 [Methylobacter sp.]|nr:hypothetical protein [Methylobacter sp.]